MFLVWKVWDERIPPMILHLGHLKMTWTLAEQRQEAQQKELETKSAKCIEAPQKSDHIQQGNSSMIHLVFFLTSEKFDVRCDQMWPPEALRPSVTTFLELSLFCGANAAMEKLEVGILNKELLDDEETSKAWVFYTMLKIQTISERMISFLNRKILDSFIFQDI